MPQIVANFHVPGLCLQGQFLALALSQSQGYGWRNGELVHLEALKEKATHRPDSRAIYEGGESAHGLAGFTVSGGKHLSGLLTHLLFVKQSNSFAKRIGRLLDVAAQQIGYGGLTAPTICCNLHLGRARCDEFSDD